ncbi:MAG: polysaccharide pyruvyl transferase family protein [Candidatus Staskawiczbacteria bacterium]
MKSFWYKTNNFGDTLTPIIVGHFLGVNAEYVEKDYSGKLLAVGSILDFIKENDVIWGTGLNKADKIVCPSGAKFLAVRGPITRSLIVPELSVPEIYGDPAILLPLIYNPKIEKKYEVGYVPHYVDKKFIIVGENEKMIDIESDWKTVIEDILSCKKIISSSLHGIICAEAYGIPATWAVYSDWIIGGELKYQDYFLGSGREKQIPFHQIPPIENLAEKQNALIKALKDYFI